MFSTMFQQDFEFYIITRLVTWETRDLPSSLPNWGAVKQSCLHILTPWKVRTAVSRDSGCAFLNVLAGLACLVACTFTWHHCQSVHCCAAQTKEQLAVGGNNNKGTSTSACSIAQTCRPADLSSSRVLIKLTLQNYSYLVYTDDYSMLYDFHFLYYVEWLLDNWSGKHQTAPSSQYTIIRRKGHKAKRICVYYVWDRRLWGSSGSGSASAVAVGSQAQTETC